VVPPLRWAVGIENTFIPQPHRRGRRILDEYELVGHYEHWQADLDLVATLGIDRIRYGIPWYRVNPAPGRFDWSWTDRVIPYLVERLGIAPILDLVHYGCPTWLTGEFLHPEYPERVAEYAAAVVGRYAGLVREWTPLNEPNVNATWCGRLGLWPPYSRGWSGFVGVLMAIARGMALTTAAIRSVDPGARVVMVEATEHAIAGRRGEASAELAVQAQFLPTDLLLGRVTGDHRFAGWLTAHGARDDDLARLAEQPGSVDTMGVNFYPGWSLGRYALAATDADGAVPRRRRVYAEATHLEAVIRA
jgi:beta-glucosidase/6-phospho-beta-glucosidase/beta-galactosidase